MACKRQSLAPASVEKRAKKQDPMIAAVIEAVEACNDLPASCKDMLVAGCKHSLSCCVEERHPHQVCIVGLLESVVQVSLEQLKSKQADMETAASSADVERSRLEQAMSSARVATDKAAEVVVSTENAAVSLSSKLEDAQQELARLEEERQRHDASHKVLEAERQELMQVLENHMAAVLADDFEPSTAGEHVEVLKQVVASLQLDESLAAAFPAACAKAKGGRAAFDNMVLSELDSNLRSQHQKLSEMLDASAQESAGHAGAIRDAQEKVAHAVEAQAAAAKASAAAHASFEEASGEFQQAKNAQQAFVREWEAAKEALEAAKSAQDNFTAWNLECFNMLKDKRKVPQAEAMAQQAE